MIMVSYKNEVVNLSFPKTFLKDPTVRKFLKYIKVLEIVNKSTASEKDIEEIVKNVKEVGKKEIEKLLNEK